MADSEVGTIGPINWGSNAVNGQLVPQAPTSAFFPVTMGNTFVGPKWATQAPYGVAPVIPSPAAQAPMPPNSSIAPTQAGRVSSKGAWHPTQGTIAFGLFALIAGIFLLHYVHYGNGKK